MARRIDTDCRFYFVVRRSKSGLFRVLRPKQEKYTFKAKRGNKRLYARLKRISKKKNIMGREMNELQWHIEWRDPNTLIPYENNAKLHDGKNISNIAASIKRYGWQSYLVVTKAGVIIIGHGRRLAAIELGCKCPCKVVEDDLTDAEIRELRNVDNLTQDGKYDWDSLKVELDDFELDFGDFDFDNVPKPAKEVNWDEVEEIGEENYEKPETDKLRCPICGGVDEKIRFVVVNE